MTVTVDSERFNGLMALLAEFPDLNAADLRQLIETGRDRPRRARVEPVRPRSASELVAMVEAKVITRTEARRYLRLQRVIRRPGGGT